MALYFPMFVDLSEKNILFIGGGKIVDEFYSLVDPETHFDYFNTNLTGIDSKAVQGAPTFPELWKTIEPYMSDGILTAHNAVFDMGVLKSCLTCYSIEWKKSAKYLCTVKIGRSVLPNMRHNLNVMCEHYGIALNHHYAASDSRACAEILLRYIDAGYDVNSFIRTYKF